MSMSATRLVVTALPLAWLLAPTGAAGQAPDAVSGERRDQVETSKPLRKDPEPPKASTAAAYTVKCATAEVPLSGEVEGTPWEHANTLHISRYPWYIAGEKQATTARLLYDREAIYAQFQCRDRHIFSRTTELNGSVCLDSCVEFFATPDPGRGPHYFNLEVSCCGVMHLGFGAGRHRRLDN